MLSLCARGASRQSPRVQPVLVHSRSASSLLDLAPLHKRTLGFSKFAHKVTNDPTFDFVSLLRDVDDPTIPDVLLRHRVPGSEWSRWSPVLSSPSFQRSLEIIHRNHLKKEIPSWVILALACHKIRSPGDAESLLYDLTLPVSSIQSSLPSITPAYYHPLFVLTAHALAHFALITLLRPLTSHLIDCASRDMDYKSFYFNMFLQALSNSPRSREVSIVIISILEEMQRRHLILWKDTERLLIRKKFVMAQVATHLRTQGPPQNPIGVEKRQKADLENWLNAYASLADVRQSEHYMNAIREYCLQNGLTPPYPTDDTPTSNDEDETQVQGSAQQSNNHYLRALRNDQQSAFRYFHHLLTLDVAKPDQPPSSPPETSTSPSTLPKTNSKTNIDIYDWTTALHAGACDRSLAANDFLNLFEAGKSQLNAFSPNRVTYTVAMQGLMRKGAREAALGLWEEFVTDIVGAHERKDENRLAVMQIDSHALCAGIDVLVQNGRPLEALYLLEEAIKTDMAKMTPASSESTPSSSTSDSTMTLTPKPYSYLSDAPIYYLFRALLNIQRPDAIFYVWAHLTPLYFVKPSGRLLHILLKAALQASYIDTESVKGSMSWYFADKKFFGKNDELITTAPNTSTAVAENSQTGSEDDAPTQTTHKSTAAPASDTPRSRESLLADLRTLLESNPSVVGIWAGRRATAVARSIFRGMILGNWPALNKFNTEGSGTLSVWPELARMFRSNTLSLPTGPTPLGMERPQPLKHDMNGDPLGPPLPTIYPSEQMFFTYISLLGLSARAEEIPEALVWMRALGIIPQTRTLSLALVFWAEIGLRGPLFEDGWIGAMDWWRKKDLAESGSASSSDCSASGSGSESTADKPKPKTEYAALRAWMLDWVGEKKAPTEADVESAILQVAMMRDKGFKNRGGGL